MLPFPGRQIVVGAIELPDEMATRRVCVIVHCLQEAGGRTDECKDTRVNEHLVIEMDLPESDGSSILDFRQQFTTHAMVDDGAE